MNNKLYNPSRCADVTAKKALDNIDETDKAKELIECILRIFSAADYDVIGNIALKSRRTGRTYINDKK